MASYSGSLDRSFAALGDPTRRAIVSSLCEGPKSVTALAAPFAMALPSLLKHVRILEESGLIRSDKAGRVRTCRIEPAALRATEAWLRDHIRSWEERLDRMEAHIDSMKGKD